MVKKNRTLTKKENKNVVVSGDTQKIEKPDFDIKNLIIIFLIVLCGFLLFNNPAQDTQNGINIINDTINNTIINTTIENKAEVENSTLDNAIRSADNYLGISYPILFHPLVDIFIISLLVSLFISLMNKKFTDQDEMKRNKVDLKELQKKLKETMKTNPQKAKQYQQELMQKNLANMKNMFNIKLMLITMPIILIVFSFMRVHYAEFGEILNLGFANFGWFGTYIIFSIVSSIVLKKVLKLA